MAKPILSAEEVRALLHYDPATGVFKWRRRLLGSFATRAAGRIWNTKHAGKTTGTDNGQGYLCICIRAVSYRAHRLAWLYMTGEYPKHEIDHKNGVCSDNRWVNLRDVTPSINQQNKRKAPVNSTTGILGVQKTKLKGHPFTACIHIPKAGQVKKLGTFRTAEEAQSAYLAAKRELHPGFVW
jgi:hypothetical protein